jgi:hypothetical protein
MDVRVRPTCDILGGPSSAMRRGQTADVEPIRGRCFLGGLTDNGGDNGSVGECMAEFNLEGPPDVTDAPPDPVLAYVNLAGKNRAKREAIELRAREELLCP